MTNHYFYYTIFFHSRKAKKQAQLLYTVHTHTHMCIITNGVKGCTNIIE